MYTKRRTQLYIYHRENTSIEARFFLGSRLGSVAYSYQEDSDL